MKQNNFKNAITEKKVLSSGSYVRHYLLFKVVNNTLIE